MKQLLQLKTCPQFNYRALRAEKAKWTTLFRDMKEGRLNISVSTAILATLKYHCDLRKLTMMVMPKASSLTR